MVKEVELGMTVKDSVTGFKGVITGIVYYLTGCNQALVVPKAKGSKIDDAHWFDLQRLSQVPGTKVIKTENTKSPGFDQQPPKR
jgi:hypothetical protein